MDQIIFLTAEYLGWLIALFYLIYARREKYHLLVPFISAAAAGLISLATKDWLDGNFPSSHASTFFALTIGAYYFYPRVGSWLIPLAALMSAARVLAGFHVWFDIVGGLALALVVSGLVHFLFRFERPALTGRQQV